MRGLPKRKWFRFSLKTLLIVMTALGVWLGMYAKSFRDRRTAIVEIQQLGGAISLKYNGPTWLRKRVSDDRYFWNPIAVRFAGPHRLTDVELQQMMPHLLSFPDLNYVMLRESQITDSGIAQLLPLHAKLKTLDVQVTSISDDGIAHLKQFSKLTSLRVQGSAITRDGIAELQVALPNCKIMDQSP